MQKDRGLRVNKKTHAPLIFSALVLLQHHLAPTWARLGGCCAGSCTGEQRDGGSCRREHGRETGETREWEAENWDARFTDQEQSKEI